MKKKFTFFIALCLLICTANAQNYSTDVSLSSGSYSNISWETGVTVTIPAGETVTITTVDYAHGNLIVDGNLTITNKLTIEGNLTVDAGGKLNMGNDLVFNNTVTVGGELTVAGNLTFNQDVSANLNILEGGVVTVNGPTVNLNGPASHIKGTLNIPGTMVLNSPIVMDCPGAIYAGTINNKITNPISGSGYIEASNKISSKSSFTTSSAIVINTPTFQGEKGAATEGSTSVCATLPVILSDFNATAVTSGVQLTWTTQTEINAKGFQIQVSNDGVHFRDLALVSSLAANGNSSQPLTYHFTDNQALNGIRYYRLEQISLDSKVIVVSETKKVVSNSQSEVQLYPNPASNFINVVGNGNAAVKVISINGSVVANGNAPRIDIQHLSSGVYFVQQFVGGRWISAGKFIKK